jgi:hypothetical protein
MGELQLRRRQLVLYLSRPGECPMRFNAYEKATGEQN